MRFTRVLLVFALAALSGTQASSIHRRKFRELDVQKTDVVPAAVVKELKESEPQKQDAIPVAVLIKEDVAASASPLILDDSASIAVNEVGPEKIIKTDANANEGDIERKEESLPKAAASAAPAEVEPAKGALESAEPAKGAELPKSEVTDEQGADQIRQNGQQSSTQRPTIFQAAQQLIQNNPIGQFIDTIRRPLTSTVAPSADQPAPPQLPGAALFQQFQAGVQNFTNQITSVFQPQTDPASRPPNFIEQIQNNFQNAVNSVFRPNITSSTPTNPLQVVLNPIQAVQSFFTGNRGSEAPIASSSPISAVSAAPTEPLKEKNPVDNKVDVVAKSSEEADDQDAEDLQHHSEEAEAYSAEHQAPQHDDIEPDEVPESYEHDEPAPDSYEERKS